MENKTITLTIEIEGERGSITRTFAELGDTDEEKWGGRVLDMLDVLEKSKEVKF